MDFLSKISVRRPVFATVLMLTIVVVGLVGYRSLGVDKFPRIDFPMVVVTTVYPGASPASVESDVTDKIEAAVNTVSGIETLSSVSSEGASLVFVQFALEKDPDVAAQEIRDRIATIRDLPTSIRPPQIQKADPDSSPVLMLSVKGDLPVAALTRIAEDKVKAQLERVSGVGMVRVVGGQKRRIEVSLDPIRLAGTKVTALEVLRALSVCLPSLPAGRFERGPDNATMRIECRSPGASGIGDLVVRQSGDNPIRVRDVADVLDTIADPESAAVRDGAPAILLAVRKQSGSNTVAVVDAAKAAVAEIANALPPGVTLEVVRDNSEVIRTSADQVTEHLVLGADPGRGGGAGVPRQRPLDDHRRGVDPDLDHRHLRADADRRLHAQPDDAAGAGAGGRHRHRRRDRRAREHLPPHRRARREAVPGGDQGDQGDQPRGARDDAVAHGRVPAGRVHGAASSAGS
jgi:HAE1 family hydrophobic/amphiphilic exporter-1